MPQLSPRSRSSVALALPLTAVLALTACAGPSSDAGSDSTEPTDVTLTAALIADPTTFDPAKAAGTDYQLDRLLYDSLLRQGTDGLTAGLASEWEAIDPTTYSFTIRSGATCSDGTPITGDVVGDSLSAFAADGTGWPALVFGPDAPTIEAEGDTVTVRLASAWVDVLAGLSLAQTGIVCPAGLADPEGLAAGSVAGAFSGPYTPTRVETGVGYTFTLRDDYSAWPDLGLEGGAPPAALEFSITSDQSTVANQLLAGDLDVGPVYGAEAMSRFDDVEDFTASTLTLGTTYLVFNERESSPFANNLELRRAVAQAIDREAYNTAVTGGRAELLNTVVTSSIMCAIDDDDSLVSTETQAAAPVLDGVRIRMIGSNAIGAAGAASTFVQESLQALGAEVELDLTDNATWSTNLRETGTWDLTVLGDINAIGTVSSSLTRSIGTSIDEGGRNYGASQNTEGEAALAAAAATTDAAEQCTAFETAQRSMLERVDAAPLSSLVVDWVARDGVQVAILGGSLDWSAVRVNA